MKTILTIAAAILMTGAAAQSELTEAEQAEKCANEGGVQCSRKPSFWPR